MIRDLGGPCELLAAAFASVVTVYRFVAVEQETCATSFARNLQLIYSPGAKRATGKAYIDQGVPGLPEDAEVIARGEGTVDGESAGFATIRQPLGEFEMMQDWCLVYGSDGLYFVTLTYESADSDASRAVFDQIVSTIRIR